VGSVMALSDDELDKVSDGILDSSTNTLNFTNTFSVSSFSLNFVKISY
jgi:hypothetical protein